MSDRLIQKLNSIMVQNPSDAVTIIDAAVKIKHLQDEVAELQQQLAQHEWVSVEKKRPSEKDHIQAYSDGIIYSCKYRYGVLGEPAQDHIGWRSDCSGRFGDNFTHWKPIIAPTAPKEEE